MWSKRAIGASLLWVAGPWAAASAAAQDDVSIRGVGIRRTITCDERAVKTSGTGHRLTLLGRCQRVVISGNSHVVHVEGLGRATVSGMNNRLEWEYALDGDRPRVTVSGIGNQAVKAARGSAGAAPAEDEPDAGGGVAVEGESGRVILGPGGVTVEDRKGSGRDRVTVGGSGGVVAVEGDSGRVVVGAGGITVEDKKRGGRDRVTVGGGGSTVSVEGRTGTVRVTGRGAAVTVAEDELERTFDCAGGNAEVRGNENQLTLRDCRELTITGNGNRVTLVGAVRLIRLPGNDNEVTWSEGVDGSAPSLETLGSGNRVSRSRN